jgi:hypothetical protein
LKNIVGTDVGEVPRVGGLEKRVFLSEGGRTGSSIARKVQDELSYMPAHWVNAQIEKVATIAQLYRLGVAGYDMGVQGIQLMASLGIDFFNLMTYPAAKSLEQAGAPITAKLTAMHPTATARSIWGFFDPKHEINYWLRRVNFDALEERALYGSLVQPSEYTQGQAALKTLVDRIPLLGPRVLNKVVDQTFGRADLSFKAGRNIVGNEMWKAFRDMAAKTDNLPELAKFTNIATGVFSLRGIGTTAAKSNFMNAFMFFSPRYTYAQGALIANIFAGGYTSRQAIKAVTGILGLNTMVFTLAALALDQEPKVKPWPKKYGGDGSDVWTLGYGDSRLGVTGSLYTPLKFILDFATTMADEPDKLLTFNMENPIVRWWRYKASGPTNWLWGYASGRDPIGDPTRDGDSIKPTVETAQSVATSMLPIWGQTLLENKDGWLPVFVEWTGGKSKPVSEWDQYFAFIEEVANKSYKDIPKNELAILKDAYPVIDEMGAEAAKKSAALGYNEEQTDYWKARNEVKFIRDITLNKIQDSLDNNMLERHYMDAGVKIREAVKEHANGLERANLAHPDVVADLDAKQPKFPVEAAYKRYWEIFYDEQNRDDFGDVIDYDKRDDAIKAFLWTLPQETVREPLLEWIQLTRQKDHPLLQEYYRDHDVLSEYWDVKPRFLMNHGFDTMAALKTEDPSVILDEWNSLTPYGKKYRREYWDRRYLDMINELNAQVRYGRAQLREANEDIAAALMKWYGSAYITERERELGEPYNPDRTTMPPLDPSAAVPVRERGSLSRALEGP